MAICFNGDGSIRLKKETAKEFTAKFKKLSEEYDSNSDLTCNDNGLLQFRNYARYSFISDCKQFIEDNVDSVKNGKVWFSCHDEDGSVDKPFPFTVLLEVVDGKVYEETLHTRLPYDWDFYNDADGFNESKDLTDSFNKFSDSDELPF